MDFITRSHIAILTSGSGNGNLGLTVPLSSLSSKWLMSPEVKWRHPLSENVLQQLSKGLPEIYQRLLFRIVEDGQASSVNRSLRWVGVVKCPLRLEELLEAMAIKLGNKLLQRDRLINRINGLISWCDNLVTWMTRIILFNLYTILWSNSYSRSLITQFDVRQ